MCKKEKLLLIFFLFIFFIEVLLMTPQKGQSPEWSTAYFSGAVELKYGLSWRYDLNQVDVFKQLEGYEIYTHNFDGNDKHLVGYSLNNTGLLYLIFLVNLIIPVLGPLGSLVLTQIISHFIISLLILKLISDFRDKVLFVLFYTINPLVVHFVLFPLYYFWQVVPSVLFIIVYSKSSLKLIQAIFFCFLLVLSYAIRPTTILIVLFTLGLMLYKMPKKMIYFPFLIFVGLMILYQSKFNLTKGLEPWHTVFIGVGAYPNPYPYLPDLSDNNGYKRFEQVLDIKIYASAEGNYQNDSNLRLKYSEFLKGECIKIVKEHPVLLLRNGIINYLAGFSLGYHHTFPFGLQLLISLFGCLVIYFLFKYKMFIFFFAISLSHITFTPYYPPIYAYYYGTIILLVFAAIKILNRILEKEGRSELLELN